MDIIFPWEHEEHLTVYPETDDGSEEDTETLALAMELTAGGNPARAKKLADGLEALAAATDKTPREIVDAVRDDD